MSVNSVLLQCKWDEARQRIRQDPLCVYEILPSTGRTALHELCRHATFMNDTYCNEDPNEYSDDNRHCPSSYQNQHEFHTKDLAQLIIETSHTLVLQKLEVVSQYMIHPIEQSILIFKDCNGNIPLHILCQGWNVNKNIMSLLFGYCKQMHSSQDNTIPTVIELILHKNYQQCTSLHFVFQCVCSISIWKIFLDQFPIGTDHFMLSQMRDVDGETPLHWAFAAGISKRRLQLYLKTFTKEGLFSENNSFQTPLDAIVMDDFDSACSMWHRVAMILNVILEQDDPIPPMFALAELSNMVPHHWLELGLRFYREGLEDMDDQGRCPLHVAGMCPSRKLGDAHFLTLLQEYPAVAQQQCHQGRLPLHYVLETGKSLDCVQALVLEYPDVWEESDPVSGLPCFLLATATDIDVVVTTDDCLSCTMNRLNNCYFLLQEDPAVVHRLSNGFI